MVEKKPITFDEVQAMQADHARGLSISHTAGPAYDRLETVRRMREEVDELEQAIKTEDLKEITSEIGDLIGLIVQTATNFGVLAGDAALNKIKKNNTRYPRDEIDRLLATGMHPREVFPHMRTQRKLAELANPQIDVSS